MTEIRRQEVSVHVPGTEPTGGPRRRWMRILWPLAIALLIFFASSRSTVATPGITKVDDKFAHFGAYGLLATLLCRLGFGWKSAAWALVTASLFGASDEWHQSFVPGRFSDLGDWMADTLGAAVAVALYAGCSWYRRTLEWEVWPRRGRAVSS